MYGNSTIFNIAGLMGQTTNQQIETIYAENFARKYEKKILVTSDAWLMNQSSQGTSVLY